MLFFDLMQHDAAQQTSVTWEAYSFSFEKDLDGTVTGSYTTAAGLTLEQCKAKCADGTWSGCVGFSRYSASSDTAAASCWWVANVGDLSYDDGNDNENMYKLTTAGIFMPPMLHHGLYTSLNAHGHALIRHMSL